MSDEKKNVPEEQKTPKFGLTALVIFLVVIILFMVLDSFVLTPVIDWIKNMLNW